MKCVCIPSTIRLTWFLFLVALSAIPAHSQDQGRKRPLRQDPAVSVTEVVYPTLGGVHPADSSRHFEYLQTYGITREEYRQRVQAWFDNQVQGLRNQEAGANIQFQLNFAENLGYAWSWRASFRDAEQRNRIQKFFQGLDSASQEFTLGLMRERGFVLERQVYYVDYVRMVEQSRGLLADWVERFVAELRQRRLNREQALVEVLRFCQKIPYLELPVWEQDRFIAGFYPPNFLLANRYGDCDMKAVLFAVIWEAIDPGGVALVLTSNHMFAAVRGFSRRRSTHQSIRIGNAEFLCVEPVGEALTDPGVLADFSMDALRANDYRVIYPLTRR